MLRGCVERVCCRQITCDMAAEDMVCRLCPPFMNDDDEEAEALTWVAEELCSSSSAADEAFNDDDDDDEEGDVDTDGCVCDDEGNLTVA